MVNPGEILLQILLGDMNFSWHLQGGDVYWYNYTSVVAHAIIGLISWIKFPLVFQCSLEYILLQLQPRCITNQDHHFIIVGKIFYYSTCSYDNKQWMSRLLSYCILYPCFILHFQCFCIWYLYKLNDRHFLMNVLQ